MRSNRLGRSTIAGASRSGWLVVATVSKPSFFRNPSSSFRKNDRFSPSISAPMSSRAPGAGSRAGSNTSRMLRSSFW
nr:hypothetical protein [Gemmata obscuriglobus]